MHTDRPLEQSAARQDAVHIGILSAIALAIGIYLIVTAVVISKDGANFVEFARNLRISPTETVLQEPQHPGYPYMILAAQRIAQVFCDGSTLPAWVYSAQGVALIFKLLAIVMIYFLGKLLVGPKSGFVAALLLIVLPIPARYGSDALSDWPGMFFVIAALLLLMRGAIEGKWWLFGLAGVFAGAGYLVRPECSQIIAYGFLWLTLQLLLPKRSMARSKAVFAMAALFIGFCALAAPYMILKGAIFPKKGLGEFASNMPVAEQCSAQPQEACDMLHAADVVPAEIVGGVLEMFGNIGETVMWFFSPALLIGLCDYLKRRRDVWRDPKRFFVVAMLVFNAALVIWLYAEHGYMSKRHTLLMVVILAFYIRPGLKVLAALLSGIVWPRAKGSCTADDRTDVLYLVLLAVGISLCIPKLLRPIHHDKLFIRRASQWLAANSEPEAVIAAHDSRISFYSGRKGIAYDERNIPEEARYVVIRKGRGGAIDKELLRVAASIEDDRGNPIATIYRRVD